MERILLSILMALSLNASEMLCQMATDNYLKNYKYLQFAYESKNIFKIKWKATTTLSSLERVMVECDLNAKQTLEAQKQREQLLKVLKSK